MAPDWNLTTLGAEVDLLTGFPFKSEHYTDADDGVRLVRGDNIVQGAMRWDGVKKWPQSERAEFCLYELQEDDVVLAMDRPWIEAGLKYSAISSYDLPCLLVQRTARLRGGPRLDTKFLRYLLGSRKFTEHIHSITTGTAVPHISGKQIKDYSFLLPPPCEQKAIAAVLGTLDDKIELNRQMNATLETMARAHFQSWFVDFDPVRAKLDGRQPRGLDAVTAALFPAVFEESNLGHIPKGWTIAPVGDVVACVGGATPSTSQPAYWEGGIHRWTTPKDFSSLQAPVLIDTERRVTDAGVAKISSGLLPRGTLLLSSRAPVGYLALAAIPVAINQGFIAMKCNERASNYFMLNWCQANMAEIESRATGTTFAEISKQNFRPIPVILPPKELMAAFTAIVAPFYTQITANLHESRTLAALRDTLLPKLLSGEVRVPVGEVAFGAGTTDLVRVDDQCGLRQPSPTESFGSDVVAFPDAVPTKKTTDEFVEAVVIAQLVKILAKPEYPVGRFRYNKFAYLAHRKVEDDTTKHYLKKAAGPYSPWAKYSGPEAIAKRNGYVREVSVNGRKGFVPAEKIDKIEPYATKYPVCSAVDWVVAVLRYRKNDDLEVLTTVDFAAVELAQQGQAATLDSIKRVIATNKEWAPKLRREIFSDENIASALAELATIYPALYKS